MAWIYLAVAILTEVVGTLALKASDGFTRIGPAVVVVVTYGLSFVFLALALRSINVGPVYAIWSGIGTVGAALGGWLLFTERLSPLTLVGMAIVVAGIVVMNLGGVSH
jgi:small multidrug resistance pump